MPTHNRTLIDTITDKAKATWNKPITSNEDYKAWEKHWLMTGKAWRDGLASEGLSMTIKGLDKVLNYFEGLINERTGQGRDASNPEMDG